MLGTVILPTAVVASVLVAYFNWRTKLRRRVLAEGNRRKITPAQEGAEKILDRNR